MLAVVPSDRRSKGIGSAPGWACCGTLVGGVVLATGLEVPEAEGVCKMAARWGKASRTSFSESEASGE
jgi:hypothetical protein